jgi:hypothetical protein
MFHGLLLDVLCVCVGVSVCVFVSVSVYVSVSVCCGAVLVQCIHEHASDFHQIWIVRGIRAIMQDILFCSFCSFRFSKK